MRFQRNLVGFILTIGTAGVSQLYGWVQGPTEATGYYYMYDDLSDPPFSEPVLPPMPVFESIWDKPGAEKCFPLGDRCNPFSLPDSFWFCGHWYVPGDKLCFAADGWISFDVSVMNDGAPLPPIADPPFPFTEHPNSLMAPLWQNNNPPWTAEPSDSNRLWYYYDADSSIVVFQWFAIQNLAQDNVYDYEMMLHLGGQNKLVTDGDSGVVFSYHFIEYLYNTSSAGWTAEEHCATGLENETGTQGITYPADSLADGRVIRMGYKKSLDHDVTADEIIVPASLIKPNTVVDPITVIGNYGNNAETFDAILNIYDYKDSLVYHNVITLSDGIDFGADTLGPSKWPLWTPEGPGKHYLAELRVSLDEDQCPDNDTLRKDVWTSADVTETMSSLGFEFKIDDIQTFRFSVPYTTRTKLAIYDVSGNNIRELTDKIYPTGTHILYWNGCDAKGYKIARGVYFVHMETGDWEATRKVIVY